ncbi:hypothetical protein GL218_03037 [Daldinia childiae]|uniref:uncharacterized protein n=1 Tax=Daldinia childiae TaxID=326645 RepID=UPI001446050B|nr:uncharacterized protein GL218_03037 [Daldinia childiae]KAF3061573.1 hypothetical protein GL218_03037 [Daldinia childiae]
MSYSVFGFALRDRTWAQLDLAYLTEVTPIGNDYTTSDNANEDESAFNRLVLDQKIKDMVLSLIAQHFRNKESQQNADEQLDIVRGKGKGLIILLHGAPGVGKTTTAEGVAERFNKPLFQITCGDLGSTAKEVEDALSINFSLANRWGCILLLDEADVFSCIEKKRGLYEEWIPTHTYYVSQVFLRVLEYYAGILFLTTNRIGDFDEAFASRIHMSLYYPPLDEIATNRIFKLNFDLIRDRYKKNGRLIDIDDSGIYSFVTKFWMENQQARWNGRQIRNACQTALALAEFEALPNDKRFDLKFKSKAKVHLKRSNIETVSDAYLEFIKYLKAVHGTDQETHAKELGIRAMEKVFDSMMNERVSRGGNPVPQERTQNQNPLRSFRIPDRSPPATQTYPSFEQHREAPYNSPGPAYRNPSPSSGAGYSSHGYQPDNPFLQAPHASHASSGYGATQQYPRHTQSASTEGPSAYPPGPSQPQYYHQGQGSGMTNDPRFAQSVPGQGARPQYQGWRSEAYPVAGQEITETTGVNLTSIPVSYSTEDPNIQHSASSNSQ